MTGGPGDGAGNDADAAEPVQPAAEEEEDLTGDESGPPFVVGQPYDPEPAREKVRGRLAWVLLFYLGVALIGPLLMIVFDAVTPEEGRDLITLTLGAMGTLAGTVLGFYFGRLSKG